MFNNKSELNVRYNFRILNLFYVFLFFKLLSGEMKNTHNSFNSGNLEPSAWLLCIVLYCIVVGSRWLIPPPPMHCSRRLIVRTLVFSHSYLNCQVSPPETLVVKGGTTWTRNGRRILPENARLPRNIQGSFTCCKSTKWDKRLYFPFERRRAEDFLRPEKSDGLGRV